MAESATQDRPNFDELLQDLLRQGARNPAVRIETRSGEVVFEGAAGAARPDGPEPMTPDTPFHLASVTKTMTAAALLQLAEAGSAGPRGVDAPLAALDVLPTEIVARLSVAQGVSHGEAITLRHLLTHTAGMRDAMEDDGDALGGPAPGSFVGRLLAPGADVTRAWPVWDASRPLDPEAGVVNLFLNGGCAQAALGLPGGAFHYSDTGYMLLGLAVERLAGRPLHAVFRERLFAPMGMDATYLAYADDPPGLGPRRRPEAEVWMGARPFLSAGASLAFDWAGGGVVSTARDLIAFLRGLLEGRLFRKAETLAAMTRWISPPGLAPPRIGLGLGLDRLSRDGIELVGRTGAWGARMVREPTTGLVLAGTINQAEGPRDWAFPFVRLAMRELGA